MSRSANQDIIFINALRELQWTKNGAEITVDLQMFSSRVLSAFAAELPDTDSLKARLIAYLVAKELEQS